MGVNLQEIKVTDIDFPVVDEQDNPKVVLRYIQLLDEDGGMYPELYQHCKARLLILNPKMYYLHFPRKASVEEEQEMANDIFNWESEVKRTDDMLKSTKTNRANLPPVRGTSDEFKPQPRSNVDTVKEAVSNQKSLLVPRESRDGFARDKTNMKDYYRNWEQVDVDEMEQEIEAEEEKKREENKAKQAKLQVQQDYTEDQKTDMARIAAMLPVQREQIATSEKDKGNEAFYAGDLQEAEMYYTRSILHSKMQSVYTNRALVRLKTGDAAGAKADCDAALKMQPDYMKALHRRGKANFDLGQYLAAIADFQSALKLQPGNAQINGDLREARKRAGSLADKKVDAPVVQKIDEPTKFRRVQILDCSDSDESDDEAEKSASPAKETSKSEQKQVETKRPATTETKKEPTKSESEKKTMSVDSLLKKAEALSTKVASQSEVKTPAVDIRKLEMELPNLMKTAYLEAEKLREAGNELMEEEDSDAAVIQFEKGLEYEDMFRPYFTGVEHSGMFSHTVQKSLAVLRETFGALRAGHATALYTGSTPRNRETLEKALESLHAVPFIGQEGDFEEAVSELQEAVKEGLEELEEEEKIEIETVDSLPAGGFPTVGSYAASGSTATASTDTAASKGFKKMTIVEDSDSEEETAKPAKEAPKAAAKTGFKKIQIQEESDSEEDPPKQEEPKKEDANRGFKKMQIVEESDSDEETQKKQTQKKEIKKEGSSSSSGFKKMQIVEEDSEDEDEQGKTVQGGQDTESDEQCSSPSDDYSTTTSESIIIVDPSEAPAEEDVYIRVGDHCLKKVPLPIQSVENNPETVTVDLGSTAAKKREEGFTLLRGADDPENALVLAGDPIPDSIVVPSDKGIEVAKKTGNNFFKAGKYEGSLRVFKKCIYTILTQDTDQALTPHLPLLWSNIGFAYLKLEKYAECEQACSKSLKYDGTNTKARYRRAQARLHLKKYGAGLEDVKLMGDMTDQVKDLYDSLKGGLNEDCDEGFQRVEIEEESEEEETASPKKPIKKEPGKAPSPAAKKPVADKVIEREVKPAVSSSNPAKNKVAVGAYRGSEKDAQDDFEKRKAVANTHFSHGRLAEAIDAYQECLDFASFANRPGRELIPAEKIAVIYTNRAVTYFKLERYVECEADATKSLELNDMNTTASATTASASSEDKTKLAKAHESIKKAVYKRAQARLILDKELGGALQDINRVMAFPGNKADFMNEADKIKKQILAKMVDKKRQKEAEEMRMSKKKEPPTKTFTAPKTAYDFQRVLSSIRNYDIEYLLDYLSNHVTCATIQQIFKRSSIETDHLAEVIQALHSDGEPDFDRLSYLSALSKTHVAALQFSMLSDDERRMVADIIEKGSGSDALKEELKKFVGI